MEKDDGCRCFQEIRFSEDRAKLIGWIRGIIDEYQSNGFILTVRQIYYQAVSRDLVPNTDRSYDRVQSAINDGRIAGLLPWDAVEDRGRSLMGYRTYVSTHEALKEARRGYKIDMWHNQEWRPEVWVEKAALEGVVGSICNSLRVDYYATRGYDSQSQQYRAGQRLANYIRRGQRPIIFHLGDHDPSGIDMTRDLQARLELFTGVPVIVQRLALNMNQVDKYNPPPNPAKINDPRAGDYIARFGHSSWELDALDPRVIQDLISSNIALIRDESMWSSALAEEIEDLRTLDSFIEATTYGLTGEEDDE